MKELEKALLKRREQELAACSCTKLARHALSVTGIDKAATSLDDVKDLAFAFDIDLKTQEVTDQKQSGRCWIFAALNVLREELVRRTDAKNVELSESYVAFYDKLEKLNYALELISLLHKKGHDDRTLTFLLQKGIEDGGQWDMFVNVVKKYGVCPKAAFPETASSSATRLLNTLLATELRRFASEVGDVAKKKGLKAVEELKDGYLQRFHRALVCAYGVPPTAFDFEYVDKTGKYHVVRDLTPESFQQKYFPGYVDKFVSIINAPTKEKPFLQSYTVRYLNNVAGTRGVHYLNLPIERLRELALKQLSDQAIVWFGSDVGNYFDRKEGIWDDRKFDYETLLGLDCRLKKGDALDYRASAMNHAMCLTGVALKDGVPVKWKVENSWGDDRGRKGYYLMSASFFDRYVYQAVINVKYLTEEEKAALLKEPIVLEPWDPMGSLAD